VLPPGCDVSAVRLPPPPLIVKPLRTDASEGIDATSVIHEGGADRVAAVARRIHEQFGQPALAEQFIDGREVNVSLIERDGSLAVLPLAEIDFSAFAPSQPRIVDYAAKWIEDSFAYRNTPRRIPAALDETVACRVRECARAAWNALGCRDYVRVDIRVDAQGTPFVIEVNANPDISPDAGFAAALAAGGLSFADFVLCLLRNASGGEFAAAPAAGPAPGEPGAGRLLIRWSLQSDRDPVLQIVRAAGVFRPREIAVAEEVLDSALAAGTRGHYQSYTAVLNDQILGWICFGSTPCTESTFDIYWIAVSRDAQRGGVGSSLLAHAEQLMRARGGTMAVADTSGRTSYEPAQGFYVRHGFRLTARVPDFYEKGDEKLVFAKPL
jgi:ribosomal protein S18 acetylase RimI-like enzyme